MGIKIREVNKNIMTLEEFKKWMLKEIDDDKDGKINKDELAAAVRRHGGWFANWKAKWGVWAADSNGNGVVDDSEIILCYYGAFVLSVCDKKKKLNNMYSLLIIDILASN
ncbi:hypothetical protein POTOM_047621 [Populus tomentosa]|uniref:EF-hand domain-containing protein n=1 Tax=Populus tomentosa TaxID=118781 RepID=A0A8X7YME3_POPTO|nr:hypothetical protein POTOM_047621 [Populus tomentosa]